MKLNVRLKMALNVKPDLIVAPLQLIGRRLSTFIQSTPSSKSLQLLGKRQDAPR